MEIVLIVYLVGVILTFVHGTALEFEDGTVYDGPITRTVGALLWPLVLLFLFLLTLYLLYLVARGKVKNVKFYWRTNAKGNSHGRS